MKIPLQITLRDISGSDAIETAIREKAEKLDHFYAHIMSCHVTVEMPGKHKHQGNEFNVRIDITVPGSEIVVNRAHNEDFYVALRDAFEVAKRQLEDYGRKQRGGIKVHEPEFQGRIARLFDEEGVGFIQTADGRELYFSRDSLVNIDFEHLELGLEVHFIEEPAREGMQAKRISVSKHATAETSETSETSDIGGDYHRCEISRGAASRAHEVDADKASATFTDGIVELTLSKIKKSKRHTVKLE